MSWLTQTKLELPRLRKDAIARPHLLELLHSAALTHRLTLISAPPGYGKTTLLASLAQTFPDLALAWLSLDAEDDDPIAFISAMIAALQRLAPPCGTVARSVLAGMSNPAAEAKRVVGVLINEILDSLPQPFVFVLDDLHLINDPIVYQALDYLLEHLPSPMHLVVGTRHDPPLALARLRARGELAELRMAELRFTLSETNALLNEQLRLGLSAQDLATLYERTEGWAVGLRLLANTLQAHLPFTPRTDFILRMAQSQRHIFDLLAEEVLHRQRPELKTFLLETSILIDLTIENCRAVTLRDDVATLLDEIYRNNLFLVLFDESASEHKQTNWTQALNDPTLDSTKPAVMYRYHETFAAFLRQRLAQSNPEYIAELHLRAATVQSSPIRVVHHLLEGGHWAQAAQAIAQVGTSMLQQGELVLLMRWITSLPEPTLQLQPKLLYFLGVCHWHQRRLTEASSCLEQAVAHFERSNAGSDLGQALAQLSDLAFFQAEFARGLALIERALMCPVEPVTRVQLLITRARIAFSQGHIEAADSDVEAAMQVVQQRGDLGSLHAFFDGFILGFAGLPGRLDRLERLCAFAADCVANAPGHSLLLQVAIEEQRMVVHFYRGDIEASRQSGLRAQALAERLGGRPPRPFWMLQTFLMTAHLLCGYLVDATPITDRLLAQQDDLHPLAKAGFLYVLGRVCWLSGRLSDMQRVYDQMDLMLGSAQGLASQIVRAMFQGLLAFAKGQLIEAERVLKEAAELESNHPMFNPFGSARITLARVYLAMNRLVAAQVEVTAALEEVMRQGTPGRILMEGETAVPVLQLLVRQAQGSPPLIELAHQLLVWFGFDQASEPAATYTPVTQTGERLSPRETEILRLIIAGANNQMIAQDLVLSIHTVKRHVANILNKLNVASRGQAAARARELGIE